jgi:hypothetical protein
MCQGISEGRVLNIVVLEKMDPRSRLNWGMANRTSPVMLLRTNEAPDLQMSEIY